MTLAEVLTAVAVVLSTINAVVLVLTFRRAGQWRDSEEAKALVERLAACEADVSSLKTRMENVATKADMARVTGEVESVEKLLKNTDAAVVRIEQFLLHGRAHA